MAQTDTFSGASDVPTPGAGLCLLSLDGGGVRGISTLLILQRLMETINADNPPKPCDYFDMIGGTSTGGLIAVMLGRLRMSVDEAYDAYMRLAPHIFSQLHYILNWKGETQGRYNSKAIVDGVVEILKTKNMDQDELLKDTSSKPCRTFVCATSKEISQTVVLSSYYSKRRGTSMRNKAKLWEAVRATSAASSFFDPITIDGLEFVDGATGANNPLDELWTEATDTFKTDDQWTLEHNIQCLVSIGTGRPTFKAFNENISKITGTLTAIATDTEKVWENFNRQHRDMVKNLRVFRFNVDRGLEGIELDETKSISTIRSATDHYLQTEKVLGDLTNCGENVAKHNIIHSVYDLARENTIPTLADIQLSQNVSDVDLESLWQGFRNTFAYDQWAEVSDQRKSHDVESGSPHSSILLYDSSSALDTFNIDRKTVGAVFSAYLSMPKSKVGKVFYSQCTPKSDGPSKPSPDELDFWTSLAVKVILAQLICSEPVQKKLHQTWVNNESLCSVFSNSTTSLTHLFTQIDMLCSHFEEKVTIVFSVDGSGSGWDDSVIQERIFEFVSSEMENWRLLLEGSLRSSKYTIINQDSEHQDCLSSLSFDEIDFYTERIPAALPGTNQWLWTHKTLQAWLQANSGILWIQGKPGSGKSVLARTIVERGRSYREFDINSQRMAQEKLWTSAHRWVYSRRFEDIYTNHSYMMRSLIFQALQYDKRAFQHVRAFWRENRNVLRIRSFQPFELQEMLRKVVNGLEKVLLFVIDGFDESTLSPIDFSKSQKSGREESLLFLTDLVSKCNFIKFIILSRPETDIERILSDHPDCYSIVLQQENEIDIRALIDAQLMTLESNLGLNPAASREFSPKRPRLNLGTQSIRVANLIRNGNKRITGRATSHLGSQKSPIDRIREYLAKNAQGSFLWVNLIFKELRELATQGLVSWSDIEIAIKGLPTDLMEMYHDITKDLETRHSSRAMRKAQKALEWVHVASTMDGNFTLQVLREALSIPLADQAVSLIPPNDPFDAFQSLDDTWLSYRRSLYKLCGPFIDVIRPKNEDPENFGPLDTVQMIHTTAKDFLSTTQAGPLQYVIEDSQRRVEEDVKRYLRLSFPAGNSTYCPFPVAESNHWETNITEMLEYLEGKPLLAFSLKVFPRHRALLPTWTHDIGRAALAPSLLNSLADKHQWHAQKLDILEYARRFYVCGGSPTAGMIQDSMNEEFSATSAALGKFFCEGCYFSFGTALENLTVLLPADGYRRDRQILNGVLITAICQRQRLNVLQLTLRNRHQMLNVNSTLFHLAEYKFHEAPLGSEEIMLVKTAAPFLELALHYGDSQIFDTLYERLNENDEDRLVQWPQDTTVHNVFKNSWREQLEKAPDPLHMLAWKPLFDKDSQESISRAVEFVMKTYLPKKRDKWKKGLLLVQVMLRFKSGGRRWYRLS